MWSGNQWSRRGRESRGGRGGVYGGYGRNTIQPKFISLDDFEQSNPFDMLNDSVIQSDGDDEGSWDVAGNRKRQRISTGGRSQSAQVPNEPPDLENLTSGDKLDLILAKMSMSENRLGNVERKIDSVISLRSHVNNLGSVVRSQSDRLKLLEYRSIDIEARSRRCNVIFYGLKECRNENAFKFVSQFLQVELDLDEPMLIERAHRLGPFRLGSRPRPIIAAFSSYRDVELIMSHAHLLAGKPFSLGRDFPKEIMAARKVLWSNVKEIKSKTPDARVKIQYPAKLIVNGVVVKNMFPDWGSVIGGHRIDTEKYFGLKLPAKDTAPSFNSHNSEMTQNSVGQGHYMGGHSSPNNNIERSMEYDDTYSQPANLDDREFPNLSSADPAARTTGDKTYISSTNIVVHGSEPPSPAHVSEAENDAPIGASQPHVESSALNEASGGSEPMPSASNENGESNLPPNETVSSEHDRVSRTQKRAEDIKKQVERQRSRTSSRRRDSLSSSQKPPPPPGGADKNHQNVKQDASK